MGTFNKQLCAGVAAAGIVGLGSVMSAGVASADSTPSDSSTASSADSGSSAKPATKGPATKGGPRARSGAAKPAPAASTDGTPSDAGTAKPDTDSLRSSRRSTPNEKAQPNFTAPVAASANAVSLPTESTSALPNIDAPQPITAPAEEAAPLAAQPSTPAPAVRIAPTPAPAPVRAPVLPLLPLLPTVPASAAAVGSWSATGRSRGAVVAFPAAATQSSLLVGAAEAAPTNQHVLVIGVDGTNLSAILADAANTNFFRLMSTGTSAASTMVGHTTISNPSWTGILTGVWSETAGVTNNVYTPWTYDTWPTIFNQLEAYDPTIFTSTIANWANIAQIAGSGSLPADYIRYFEPVNNDFISSDNDVAAESINVIRNTAAGTPSFQFTYFVGVDDTGHEFDAGSPQYANALRNVDQNIGKILDEIDLWEAENPGEEWTVIVTTDHGQVPWPTIKLGSEMRAHGFQTPWETTTFVIANGPGFEAGAINNTYSNIDITPTISALFGLAPEPYSAGKPLMERASNDYQPLVPGIDSIKQALTDAINMYGYPDIQTNVSLMIRTIAATIPYAIYTAFDGLATSVPEFLEMPVRYLGAFIYQMFNIPAQIIVRLTGVTGNDIIPPEFYPFFPIPNDDPLPPAEAVSCGTEGVACLAS